MRLLLFLSLSTGNDSMSAAISCLLETTVCRAFFRVSLSVQKPR
jgi:hypothetical protein